MENYDNSESEEASNSEQALTSDATSEVNTDGQGMGLDGSTPLEAGIQGRLTHAGGHRESQTRERDWTVHVDVDQPVQQADD